MTDQPPTDLRDRIAAALLARIKRATVSKAQPHDAVTSLLAANEYDLADAVLAVLPPPADRAAVLREAAAAIEAAQAREEATAWAQSDEPDPEIEIEGGAVRAMAALLRRLAAEAQQQKPDTETPCGPAPGQCDAESGEPCTNHEREAAHAEGEHCFCGPECEAACTCGVAGDALVPLGHYADCPQADEPSGAPRRARVDPDGPEKAAVCPSDGQTAPERPSRATDA